MKIQRSEKLLKTFKDSWEFTAMPKGYGSTHDWGFPYYNDPASGDSEYREWERIISERGIIYTIKPQEFFNY